MDILKTERKKLYFLSALRFVVYYGDEPSDGLFKFSKYFQEINICFNIYINLWYITYRNHKLL